MNQIFLSCLFFINCTLVASPPIYIYTDFGGGKNQDQPVSDLQTTGEIASAAWKVAKHPTLYINDNAQPLNPLQAAVQLAATFPHQGKLSNHIERIVVHVIDPGVGNEQTAQPRAAILRTDGTLFIGPDNGTLSFVCPAGTITKAIEIDVKKIDKLSGNDTQSGGTFHGRDLFSESAFRLAAQQLSLEDIGSPYPTLELKNRFQAPVAFTEVDTHRTTLEVGSSEKELFEKAFLLGMIQSSLYQESSSDFADCPKKLFLINPSHVDEKIAVINRKTGNVFVGPNNGLAVSFFRGYSKEDVAVHSLSPQAAKSILSESNNDRACHLIVSQPLFQGALQEIDFLGTSSVKLPSVVQARIWIDAYGNLKTTLQSSLFKSVKSANAKIRVLINGVIRPVIFADTFSEVPDNELFIYSGSSGVIGPNPHRSERYVELTCNGVFGKFGVDFFVNEEKVPQSGDMATFYFTY